MIILNYSINSNLSEVRELTRVLHSFCVKQKLDQTLSGQLELILVEAVNNVIKHAYKNKPDQPIDTLFEVNSDEVKITIKDKGIAVSSELHKITKSMPDINDLPEGGWGIALIHSLADHIEHYRENNKNTLIISKNIN